MVPFRYAIFALLAAAVPAGAQAADSVSSEPVAPGVTHARFVRLSGPFVVNVLSVALTNAQLDLRHVRAFDQLRGRERTSAVAARIESRGEAVLAAVNTDFFDLKTGENENNQVIDGEWWKGVAVTDSMDDMDLPVGRMASETRPAGLFAGLICSATDPVQKLKAVAEPMLGSPYRTGGEATSGFDCSGLVLTLLRSFGQAIAGRSSPEFWKQGEPVDKSRLQAGDLLFFSDHHRSIGHVAMYLSDGKFVHASVGKGVIVSELDEAYYRSRYKGARRLTEFARRLWNPADSVAATL